MLPSSGFRGEIVCHLIQRYERTFVGSWIGAFLFSGFMSSREGGGANVIGDQDDRPRLAGFHFIFFETAWCGDTELSHQSALSRSLALLANDLGSFY